MSVQPVGTTFISDNPHPHMQPASLTAGRAHCIPALLVSFSQISLLMSGICINTLPCADDKASIAHLTGSLPGCCLPERELYPPA